MTMHRLFNRSEFFYFFSETTFFPRQNTFAQFGWVFCDNLWIFFVNSSGYSIFLLNMAFMSSSEVESIYIS